MNTGRALFVLSTVFRQQRNATDAAPEKIPKTRFGCCQGTAALSEALRPQYTSSKRRPRAEVPAHESLLQIAGTLKGSDKKDKDILPIVLVLIGHPLPDPPQTNHSIQHRPAEQSSQLNLNPCNISARLFTSRV